VLLPDACKKTCDDGIRWLNRAYGRVNSILDKSLSDRDTFEQYKYLWGISE